jgi:hypothetical protein
MRRMKRAPRTTNQWVDQVKNRAIYNSGERFSSANMASAMDCDTNTSLRVLAVMADRGLISVTTEVKGSSQMYWYTKAKQSIDPIRIPWRTCSNAFTGSPHYQKLGVPI